jgi:hypothetical protein
VTEREIREINAIPNKVDRAKAVLSAQDRHRKMISTLSALRREIIEDMRREGMKPAQIARALGVSSARMSQLTQGGPGPERALIAPDGAMATVTLAVIEKRENEHDRPALMVSTHQAGRKLERLATGMDLEVDEDIIPRYGRIDLNRDNLVVMMGPRVSPVVEQVIASDPVIQWKQDSHGEWYIVDRDSGTEYHSDFDDRTRTSGVCVAHIGRIRRPDGRGSFLYLGGAHAPGTAGAVELLVRDLPVLWDQVHRSLWSGIVLTTVAEDGSITVELAEPVNVHGKR